MKFHENQNVGHDLNNFIVEGKEKCNVLEIAVKYV